ncbi:cytochrome b5 domain-containing protein 1-like [Myzus persicae]|uniref:cytochrome b5 domain-containing protein 1-like n=1 Tax=Myzus persicae TaxID=13164 RepID=UPI000B92FC62|nr:cytochrome b5 domain-containing protein 1-like [Myzus persicae]
MAWRNTYFLPEEVWSHKTREDCWLTIYGSVKNVSGLIEEFGHDGDLVNPILREAGKDVSYWFEKNGLGEIILKTRLHPETGARVSKLPFRIPHQPKFEPDVDWEPEIITTPWWADDKYNVGVETVRPINVRVTNPLIKRSATIRICLEDTVRRIMERYSVYNPKIWTYKMKYLGKPLNKNLNLSQNGVTLKYEDSVEDFVPTLMLHYQERLAPWKDVTRLF